MEEHLRTTSLKKINFFLKLPGDNWSGTAKLLGTGGKQKYVPKLLARDN